MASIILLVQIMMHKSYIPANEFIQQKEKELRKKKQHFCSPINPTSLLKERKQ